MSFKVSLTRTQIEFAKKSTEIDEAEAAVERFMEIMLDEKVDPALIGTVIDKILAKRWK